MKITLNDDELDAAKREALRRFALHDTRKTAHKHGCTTRDFEMELDSVAAEVALCRYLDKPWIAVPTVDADKHGDGGVDRVQCRQTRYSSGRLPVYKTDDPDHAFCLVTGRVPTFVVRGFIMGRDAQRDRYWRSLVPGREASYWIPQADLRPIPRKVPA